MSDALLISAAIQIAYERRPSSAATTVGVLAKTAHLALAESGILPSDVDGLGVASFTLAPDRAIDLSVKLGLRSTWLMDSGLGGASGVDLLQHAAAAIRNGDARRILLVGGDVFTPSSFTRLVREYNVAMSEDYGDIAGFGPNAMFALLTQRQMATLGLTREDYGRLVCRQRTHAVTNPGAIYRDPLSLEDYLNAPLVADPLTLFDCVPVVSGACAVIVEAAHAGTGSKGNGHSPNVLVRAIAAGHNMDLHGTDGLKTGLVSAGQKIWQSTGWVPDDVSVLALYDDYPAVVVAQLVDAGFIRADHASADLSCLIESDRTLNNSGGMLSAGQCGAGAGLHFVVDAVQALRNRSPGTKALVTGYGMVVSRYGACANAAALEHVA